MFILEKAGRIIILEDGLLSENPFLDITDRVYDGAEAGLVGLAFHPRYAENGYFFVNYSDNNRSTVIERYVVSVSDPNTADANSGTVMLGPISQPTDIHNSGCIQFGPDGYLYVGMGDGGFPGDAICQAQNGQSLLGKILRIDVDNPVSRIPPTNPFVGDPSTEDEIWATGFRNPWRFSFDRTTGDLYLGDVGQSDREEINFQPASSAGGENYGWNAMEGSICFAPAGCFPGSPTCNDPRLTPPILEYQRGTGTCQGAVMGGYVYRGCEVVGLQGTYFYGDYCTGRIWSFRHSNGQVTELLERTDELGGPIHLLTSFGEDGSGELYIVSLTGVIYRVDGTAEVRASFSPFGSGCPGSVGTPALAAGSESLPWVGETFQVRLTSMPVGAMNTPFGVLGLSSTTWNGAPLPRDLAAIGFPGCTQYVSLDYWFPLVNSGSETSWDIPLPCQPRLIGLKFFVQGAVLDFGVSGGLILTNAAEAVVGIRGKERVTPLTRFRFSQVPAVSR